MASKINIYLPKEVKKIIAEKAKKRRLFKGYKRETLSKLSGVSVSSIKRFETTGDVSLSSLLYIANSLDCLEDFTTLFQRNEEPATLKDLEKIEKLKIRKRGSK